MRPSRLNLPTALTLFRIFLVPLLVVVLLTPPWVTATLRDRLEGVYGVAWIPEAVQWMSEWREVVGVMHSHTHTDAYPSPTDVRQAVDPAWHYLIVSLKYEVPVVRSYLIVDGTITEELVVVTPS